MTAVADCGSADDGPADLLHNDICARNRAHRQVRGDYKSIAIRHLDRQFSHRHLPHHPSLLLLPYRYSIASRGHQLGSSNGVAPIITVDPKLQSFLINTMTFGDFNYVDPDTVIDSPLPFVKPWAKVDGDYASFKQVKQTRPVTNIRGMESQFGTDISGFAAHYAPSVEKAFTDDATIRTSYYAEVEALLREKLPGAVAKVVIFDHTIRRHEATSARQPVRQVHVDQTPGAAVARVRRHLPAGEAEELLQGRFQIINVWRPIGHVASDLPLALVDWRSTAPKDLVAVDLLYPKRAVDGEGDDDRGKEVRPDPTSGQSTEGYEVKG